MIVDESLIESELAIGTPAFLAGGGEMGRRIRAIDWSASPLGPPSTWPQSLRTCVRIILTSRQPMFVWWGTELINLYNDAYKAIVGGKHPEALGQPASIVWQEIWDEVGPRAESAIRDNVGTYDEALLLVMERNGYPEETYYTFSYSPVPNDDDTTGGLLCANTDDTQRIIGERQLAVLRDLAARTVDARSAEEACLRASEALEAAGRDLPFALIYSVDADERKATLMGQTGISAGHPAAMRSFELGDGEFWQARAALGAQRVVLVDDLALRFSELPTGAWDIPATRAAVVPMPRSGQTGRAGLLVVGLNPYRLFDESYRGFLELVAAQIAGSIATAEAYELERKRAEALAEIDRAKTAFFSNVSHEFRTPLTLMLGPLEDAIQSHERALVDKNLDTAYRNALRLLKLVNSLLDFSRIEAGRAQASFEPTDLAALTSDLASAFRSAIERAGLTFEVSSPPLPEPVYVDHDMWEKVVLNLLSNALKYTFDGSIAIRLLLRGDRVELSVCDTGTGIPEHELDNIFKRFHRVQGSRSRTHEGSGIGLALVHELVRIHGGEIDVESELGAGSTFKVRIPLGREHLPPRQVAAPRPSSSTATGAGPYVQEAFRWLPEALDASQANAEQPPRSLADGAAPSLDSGPRILVADDNADMRDYVARLVRERYRVSTAADGAEALESARREPPDLILTDVMMPNLDGFALLRELRRDPKTRAVPVIMLSARAGEEARIDGLEAGADDYLVKPFSARELLARVTTHLQIARLRKEALAERQRLHDIFTQAPVPVAVLSGSELRFEVANAPFREMVGRQELVGATLREAFPEVATHTSIARLEQAFVQGVVLESKEQTVNLVRNGTMTEGIFSYVAQPILDASGKPDGLIIAATEITESVLARRRVDSARQTAERANRAKDEFLSTLSHELRTPLNAMVGWSTLLRTGSVPPEQRERALEAIERNARVQARLIEDMLDLSRIEQGKLVLSVGPLELVRVVEAAIDAVRPAAEAKQIRLQPVLDSHATIVGDADRLQQVVWNLLSNAIKFTPKGGRVQVRLHREPSFVEIAVADNGQGIDARFLPHVFERFRQGDPSFTRKTGGLGLGLAIVRSLVELHGGEVRVHSDGVGQGATFVVHLPMAPLRADNRAKQAEGLGAPEVPSFECPPALKGLEILVVDDEPETRELLRFVIEQCEARVTTAGDVGQALAAVEQGRFDLLISDVGMPDEDGHSLIRKVRALGDTRGAMPALALTAYARGEDRTQALRAGFNMHLAKPIDPGELLVVMETLVRNASLKP